MFLYLFNKKGSSYKNNEHVCVTSKGQFASECDPSKTTSQCNSGLICSSIGSNTGFCLYDQGGKCANDTNCANNLNCQLNGTCGCGVLNSLELGIDSKSKK